MSATINGANGVHNDAVETAAKKALSENPGIGYLKVAPPNSTGIKIIVVGAGFAGLACAIESKRKGHDVLLLEKFKELKILGESDWLYNFLTTALTKSHHLPLGDVSFLPSTSIHPNGVLNDP